MSEITEILTPSVLQYLSFVEVPDPTERVDGGAMPTAAEAHGKVLFRQQSREATFAHGSAELGVDEAFISDAGPDPGGHHCF